MTMAPGADQTVAASGSEDPEGPLELASGFKPVDHADWQALVAKVLNRGRPEDKRLDGGAAQAKLQTTTVDGLTIECLYEAAGPDPAPTGFPGVMPFTRGSGQRPADVPWCVRAYFEDPDLAVTRRDVLADLERGVTSVWLEVGDYAIPPGEVGSVLADVLLELAPVCVSSVTDQSAAADALWQVWKDRGLGDQARGNLGFDPLGHTTRTGTAPDDTAMLAGALAALAGFPHVRAICIDLRPYHDAGAGDVDEVAIAVALGVDYLRRLETAGIGPRDAFSQIDFRVNATADQFLTTAKLRALRRLWARVGQECGVPAAERGARQHAVTSWRMISRDDPYVNMLRTTTACFGAAVGGADAVTVLPFDHAAGLPDRLSRRMARNTQIVLAEESNVGKVLDPAGGSWYVEGLTDQLAHAAWDVFREIESAGGMTSALTDGTIEARIARTDAERAKRLANRALPLTGVSMFPQVDETPLDRVERPERPTSGALFEAHRDSEVFEQMRDRAAAYAASHGAPPQVFLACLGTRRDFGAREMFTSALLAVAGLATPRGEGGTPAEIGEQAAQAGAQAVVMCSNAAQYAESGAEVAAALREAGAQLIYLAGNTSELGEHAEVVDGSLSAGTDVVIALTAILDALGAPTAAVAEGRKDPT